MDFHGAKQAMSKRRQAEAAVAYLVVAVSAGLFHQAIAPPENAVNGKPDDMVSACVAFRW